jgi:hypothetical protein
MPYDIDPVVEEIRETRRKIYARCENDPHKYGIFLQEAAKQRKARFVKKGKAKLQASK